MTQNAVLHFPEDIDQRLPNPRQFMDEIVEQMEQRFPDVAVHATVTDSIQEGQARLDTDTTQLHINSDWSVTPPFVFGDLIAGEPIVSESSVASMGQLHSALQLILDNLIAYETDSS